MTRNIYVCTRCATVTAQPAEYGDLRFTPCDQIVAHDGDNPHAFARCDGRLVALTLGDFLSAAAMERTGKRA